MSASTEHVTFGLKEVLSGDSGVGGKLGSNLTKHGEHLKGTVEISTSDETINTFESEEGGVKIAVGQNDSETTLSFEVINPSLDIMAYYMGGEVDTVGDTPTWGKPSEAQDIVKSFKFVTLSGFDIIVPFGKVVAKPLDGQIGTDAPMTLKVTVTAQVPSDTDYQAIMYSEKAT